MIKRLLVALGLALPSCGHKWRPGLTSRGAARYCNICEAIQDLSDAEFYAYFGRMPSIPVQTVRGVPMYPESTKAGQ